VLTGAAEHRERWGRTTPVVVALVDLTAGHRLDGSEVAVRDLPVALVPRGHLRSLPVGAVLRHPVRAGEVLVEDRVTSPGRSPLAAVLPEGTRAVAIPVDEATAPPLAPGDLVDVFVSVDPSAVAGPPAFAVAREVLVVDVGEHAVAVAVREDLVARVAFAAASGMVALVLVAAPAAP
jgi:Flp pilus assembly protein CpaB